MLSGKGKKGHFNEIFHRPCSLFAAIRICLLCLAAEEGRKKVFFFGRRLTWQLIKLDISFTAVVVVVFVVWMFSGKFKGFQNAMLSSGSSCHGVSLTISLSLMGNLSH
jgi:hypothetical protein